MSMPSLNVGVLWRRELLRLLCWLIAACVVGALTGAFLLCLLLAVSVYLAIHMVLAYQLHRWLVSERKEPSDGVGVWREIFVELYRVKQRNRRRKKKLTRILQEFQASTAALPDGAVVLDRLGRIVWFNQAAGVLLALRSRQDVGQRISNLLRSPGVSDFINQRSSEIGELEMPSPSNDEATVLLRLIPYGNDQRLLIARDISEQLRVDAMRRDFVANASHELRTPLTVLRGYLDMMQEESGDDHALSTWCDPIREMAGQARRMDGIIESLLKLARLESQGLQQKQTRVDMPRLISAKVNEVRGTDGNGHKYELDIDESLSLFGSGSELESIVTNLVANAARYTPSGGHIRIAWRRREQGVEFIVSDNGVGIDTVDVPRLTERFYRVDSGRAAADGGTGLGLAIVRHCVEHHEGDLTIDSQPGVGSTFTCRFPEGRVLSECVA